TDILLQASALYDRIWNAQQLPAVTALYERAVQIDPSFVEALAGLARTLLDSIGGLDDPTAPVLLERVEGLVAKAESLQPERLSVIYARGFLLQLQEHRPEAIAAFQNLIDRYPNSSVGYHMLGTNLLFVGRAADTVSMEQRSIRIDPQNPYIWQRYRRIGQASLLLGRYDVAVTWLQRALAALPSGNGSTATRAFRYAEIAAALALAGRVDEAHSAAAEANRLLPTITVREWTTNITNPVFGSQVARVLQGMRTAGVRDHADEDADFGVVSDDALHMNDYAQTPTTAPGVQTVRTTELAALLEHSKPLVLDVSGLGKSIPGAIGLRGAGIGGNTSDPFQARLARKVQALTHGDRTMPVVTMAWNADRFSGRNVALRLAALSYTNVMWYRGGREAWEVAGLPQTEVATQDW
ncbi:MAG TPA: hypothetical protein VLI93_08810, partial [Acetobacteraceae bacterium]|nr:hypothetical protein [Acetobacteraceae bacterium]